VDGADVPTRRLGFAKKGLKLIVRRVEAPGLAPNLAILVSGLQISQHHSVAGFRPTKSP
jgi:hypothetical protein